MSPIFRPRPDEVFTPRAAEINESMFIARPSHEKALQNALGSPSHIIIVGESGTGKSWLYKKVLTQLGVHIQVANMANASRMGHLDKEMENICGMLGEVTKTGYTESKQAQANLGVLSGELQHEKSYENTPKEPFERCLALINRAAKGQNACLVLDNFERVLDDEAHVRHVGDLIILLDDARYAKYNVKLMIVGVADDIRRYFAQVKNSNSITNRLWQLPQIGRLSDAQAKDLIKRGFAKLKYTISNAEEEDVYSHICWVTDKIPQQVHEYCLALSRFAEDNNLIIHAGMLNKADAEWVSQSLLADYTIIESKRNAKNTAAGRRNQCLYALGQIDYEDFTARDVEERLREVFYESTELVTLNVPAILAELAKEPKPIIRANGLSNSYRFVNARYRMAIRGMLIINDDGRVQKKDIRHM